MAWFRLYDDIVDDAKLEGLSHGQRWMWIVVLSMANRSPVRGRLLIASERSGNVPGNNASFIVLPFRTIAKKADVTLEQLETTWPLFEQLGMVHQENNVWCVSNWDKRQFKSDNVTDRTRKFKKETTRERSAEQKRNPPEAETEADKMKKKGKQRADAPGDDKQECMDYLRRNMTLLFTNTRPDLVQQLFGLCEDVTWPVALKGAQMSVRKATGSTVNYFMTVLENWKAEGLTTLEAVEQAAREYKRLRKDGSAKQPHVEYLEFPEDDDTGVDYAAIRGL